LPVEYFDALTHGAGSPETIRFLWKTELSRRLLLVVTLFEQCDDPDMLGPLPPAEAAWGILDKARETDRAAVDDLLMHPQVGNAAAYALRRCRGGADSGFPMWTDLGLVHTLALLAAARAGLPWSTSLPSRYGTVMLPTLGLATFAWTVEASTVEARTEGGDIVLSTDGTEVVVGLDPVDDTDNWWHLRHVNVGGRLPLTVWLDDLDPFRNLGDPEPPRRLDDAMCDRWRHLLDDAWALLSEHHRDTAAALAEGVVSIAPLSAQPDGETRSASNGEAFGGALISEPPNATTLAVTLVREFQHNKLGALMHLVTLHEDDEGSLYYAPWRDDPRPLGGLLHGIYASVGIADFWRRHRPVADGPDAALAEYEYLYARGQAAEALRSVRDARVLTDAGRELVTNLRSAIDAWPTGPAEPEIERLARLTADCHRTGWRLRHHRIAAGEVAVLAKAWLDGRPPEIPSPPVISTAFPDRWSQAIPTLARFHLRGTGTVDGHVPPGDLHLVRGDLVAARNACLARLTEPSDGSVAELHAWVGLALSVSGSGDGRGDGRGDGDRAATALLSRPDLVRAVHIDATVLARRPVDPVGIAAWLAPAVRER
jgi:HEXXH motif-containing protein